MDGTLDDTGHPPESKPKTKTKPSPKPRADKKSPDDWMHALQKFKVGPKVGTRPRVKIPFWQHNAAAALHGWKQHQHDTPEPLLLTEKNYLAALAAVEKPHLMPHPGALSPYCKHEFRG